MKTVIIGNGGAAMECVEALRGCGSGAEIHLMSDSVFPAMNPTLLTYFIAGKIGLENLFPYSGDFYEKHGVKLHLGSKVIKLDADGKTVENAAGVKLGYDNCVICSGASPVIPGAYRDRDIYTIRSAADAIMLKKRISKGKKALVVGASMIGVKVVEALVGCGVETSLIDTQPHMFPLAAHENCAELIECELRKRGVELYLGTESPDITTYDIIVVCVGIKPSLDFIDSGQVGVDRGVLVDRHMRTDRDGLYAAGDCAVLRDSGVVPVAAGLWSCARYMGRTAGRNISGADEECFEVVRHNITRFLGLDFVSIGDISSDGDVFEMKSNGQYCRIIRKDGRITGINLLNMPEISGILKSQVQNVREIPALSLGKAFGKYPAIREAFEKRGA